MAQVFVVVAAGSVIAFIVRDLGDGAVAGWIIQVITTSSDPRRILEFSLMTGAGSLADAKRAVAHCRAPF